MIKKLLVGMMMVLIMAVPAIALDLTMGGDFYLESYLDQRYYDESYPDADKVKSIGGWKVGITLGNMTKLDQIKEIYIEGERSTITIKTPDIFDFLGVLMADYTYWLGHTSNADDIAFVVKGTAIDNTPINFYFSPGELAEWGIPCIPDTNAKPLPMLKIKRMAIKRNGDLRVKFQVPPDAYGRNGHIRVRVLDETGGFIWQESIFPPYQIIKKDGTIIPDKVRTDIPAQYSGMKARLEYRVFEPHSEYPSTGDYMVRNITFFKLPEPDLE